MASDTGFLNTLLLRLSRGPVRLFRNSVGLGWVGKSWRAPSRQTVTVEPGDVVIRKARPLHAGLFTGSGDLIGWRTVEVTPDMVGQKLAVFVSLEAKEGTGEMRRHQRQWRDQVIEAGGVAAEVRSVEDAERALLQK